jgi:secreted trypsin-like serine protease
MRKKYLNFQKRNNMHPTSSLTKFLTMVLSIMLLSMPCPASSIDEFGHQSQPSTDIPMDTKINVKTSQSSDDVKQNHRETIVNGSSPQNTNKYQYASSLQYGSKHLCGASLIAPDIILTAAHCFNVQGKNKDWRLKVVVGEYHLQDKNDSGEVFLVEQIEVHPEYLAAKQYLENDVMVLKITGRSERKIVKLNYNPSLPVMHVGEGTTSNTDHHDALTVVGWGSLDDTGLIMANVLQEVQLGYVSNEDCKRRGVPVVTDQMMCAVDLDGDNIVEDSCYGDSGGPMILTDSSIASNDKDVQVGIVSFGSRTCGVYPGVYTRISSVYGWIKQRVCELSTDAPKYFRCMTDAPMSNDIATDLEIGGVSSVSPTQSKMDPPSYIMSSGRPSFIPINAPSHQNSIPSPSSLMKVSSTSPSKSTYEPLLSEPTASNGNGILPTKEPTSENRNGPDYVLLGQHASKDKNSATFHLETVGFLTLSLSVGAYFIMSSIL